MPRRKACAKSGIAVTFRLSILSHEKNRSQENAWAAKASILVR
jgi:hypothetical protein